MRETLDDAAAFLSPMPTATFFSEWFEKRPLLVRRQDATWASRWLTLDCFLELLSTTDAALLKLRTVKDNVMQSDVTLQQAFDAYHDGATVIANHVHLLHPPLARLCRALEASFHENFQVNAYLQPAGGRGFGAHFDSHDEFNVQLSGRKRWRVYAPLVELPLAGGQRNVAPVELAEPLFEDITESGDLLYIPRGFVHEAEATDEGPSLHMTVGMIGVTWRDLLLAAVEDVARKNVSLRRLVPLGSNLPAARAVEDDIETALAAVCAEVREAALRDAEARFVLSRRAVLPDLGVNGAVGGDTPLERNPMVIAMLERQTDHVALLFQGKRLEFPLEAATVLEHVLERHGWRTAKDLPGPLDEPNRERLLRYLYQQGLLRRML
jgi:ribosomal protein L16 Arg81 hydroxylase